MFAVLNITLIVGSWYMDRAGFNLALYPPLSLLLQALGDGAQTPNHRGTVISLTKYSRTFIAAQEI